MSILGSDGKLPNSNWQALTTQATVAQTAFAAVYTPVRQLLVTQPSTATNSCQIIVGSATLATLAPGDQYVLISAPLTTFDVAQVFYKMSDNSSGCWAVVQA